MLSEEWDACDLKLFKENVTHLKNDSKKSVDEHNSEKFVQMSCM